MSSSKFNRGDRARNGNEAPNTRSLSRRSFLQSSGAAAAAGLSASAWMAPAALAGSSGQRDVLVHIFLRGGMDGLTTCVPYGDPELYIARPNLAVPPAGAIDGAINLDGFFGLAPALSGLMTPFANRDLAIVHAAGSTDPTRSHFDAMIAMERGVPEQDYNNTISGWLARHLNANQGPGVTGLKALSMTDIMPTHLENALGALPVPDPSAARFPGSLQSAWLREQVIRSMYADAPAPLGSAMETSFESLALLQGVGFDGYTPSGGAVYPQNPFGERLRQSAALIKANTGVETISIDYEGWDLHNLLGPIDGVMAAMLANLGNSLEALYLDLGTQIDSVTVVVMSEFGRRVAENGSEGADHGHGNCMIVMGGHVNGGQVIGSWPGLAPGSLDFGDLAVTTDYRDVLWEILERRMGATDLGLIFPNHQSSSVGVIS
ncbi:MAG: hypothetical protein ACI9F9_002173 [Candidatus Paceibacteria bacterium]|jgi:uncharacterized protein (DUF1501 family)